MAGKRVVDGTVTDRETQELLDALQQMQDPAGDAAAMHLLIRSCRHALSPDVPLTLEKLQLLQCLEIHIHQCCREMEVARPVVAIT